MHIDGDTAAVYLLNPTCLQLVFIDSEEPTRAGCVFQLQDITSEIKKFPSSSPLKHCVYTVHCKNISIKGKYH